jgi:hypothetical protein
MAAHGLVTFNAGDVITLHHAADKACNVTWEDIVFSAVEMKRL